jgi:hypothetical protein
MQAPGCVAIVLAGTLMPQLWTRELSGCLTYTVSMAAVSVLHFLALLLLHPGLYRSHREAIIVTLRVLYMLANVTHGLQICSTVTKWWAVGDLESPLSAFLWRAGLIAMLWQAPAFRLPFWQHLHVQNAVTITHALLLAEGVCDTLPDISYGPELVSVGHRVLQALGSTWALLTFLVTGDPAGAFLADAAASPAPLPAASAASAAAAVEPGVSSADQGRGTCLLVVWCWQLLVGNVLIGAFLYWRGAADRSRWWNKHFSRPGTPQQPLQQQQQQQQQQLEQQQPQQQQPPLQQQQPPLQQQQQQQQQQHLQQQLEQQQELSQEQVLSQEQQQEQHEHQRERGAILRAYCATFLFLGVGFVGLVVAVVSLMAGVW